MQQKKKLIFLWFTLSLCLFLLSMSVLNIMLLFWSFFAGVGLTIYIFSPGYEVNNLFPVFSICKIGGGDAKSREPTNKCICGKDNCERQKPEKELASLQPWMGIKVTEKVNAAIEEFIDILLERHASNWYKKLSDDEAFIMELKASIRHCFAVIYRRISNLDLPDFIVNGFVPISVNHISICLKARDQGYRSEDEIMSFYSSQLHYCLKSRRHELAYIRAMCDRILTFVSPDSLIESRIARVLIREVLASNVVLPGIDTIDNPDFINNMLLLYFDDDPPAPAPGPPSPLVTLLERFSSREAASRSLLHVDLERILHTQDMLYQFMNFLKTRSAVHYLQFYLTVEDFHRRCLSQEQDDVQLKKLHCEAKDIFETYCHPDASSFIHFEPNIIQELQDISEGPWQEVTRLRTSTPLYRAFDHVYNMLENVYCPLFYEDDTYYQMMCGDRVPTASKNPYPSASSLNKTNKKKFSRKFRPSRTDTEDGLGKADMFLDNTSLESDEFDKTSLLDDDAVICSDDKFPNPNSSLSMWRLSIPSIKRSKADQSSNDTVYLFCIEVVDLQRDGDGVEKWQVFRHHNEFYSLENKLTEFHGSLSPISLPPKKFFSKNLEYLDSRRPEFEKFLKGLITSSSLHKSELLYDFLMPQRAGAVSRFNSRSGMAKVKLGNFIRRVPNKLIKEKGRHIDAFLQSFVTSCEAGKPRPSKNGDNLKDSEVIMDQKLQNDMYSCDGDWLWSSEKNKDTNDVDDDDDVFPSTPPKTALRGIFDCITLLCVRLFRVDRWLLQCLVILRILFRRTIEPFVSRHLKNKIEVYKQEHHLVRLIHLFRDVIFFDNDPPRTEALKLERKAEALRELKAFIPEQFAYLIGKDQHERSCQEFIDILQYPKLNKHLGYILLDALLFKLFPEVDPEG